MEQLILIFHVLASLAIIGLIMLQQGKGADMGASFGSGASQTLFGSSGGGNALTKITAILVTLFFATSFGLAIVAKNMSAAGGDIDIPVPAVVETSVGDSVPATDIPTVESSASSTVESASDAGLDIPSIEGAATTGEGDLPE